MGETELINKKDAIRLAEQGQIQGFPWQFEQLIKLPSIQLEQKTGKWINQDEGASYPIECSECHKEPLLDAYGYYVFSDYCPHCGSYNRGES